MTRRHLTLRIVPPAGLGLRDVRVSATFAVALGLVALPLGVAGLLAPGLLLELQTRSVTIERLAHENALLRSEKGYFEGALDQMTRRLGVFEEQARRIAGELGVAGLPALDPAAGGESLSPALPERFPFEGELRYLEARTEGLDRSFERLDDRMLERASELRARPTGMPVDGWMSHGFGWRKDPWTGEREFHRGVDIVTPEGVQIIAPGDGVVSRAGRYADYGRCIDINHGFGYVTRYAHLSEMLVKPGDRVSRGDTIGKVGSSGRTTGPHLHYEVFRDGRRENPWNYLGRTGS